MDLKNQIREIQDWPKKGVSFKDITTLLQDKESFRQTIDSLSKFCVDKKVDKIVGIDARGFLVAAPVAYKIGAGLSIVRKPGKLPYETIEQSYTLEYASNIIQMHTDAVTKGENVVLVDDLIATGGTALAACDLTEKLGGTIVGVYAVIDLLFLGGSDKLKKRGYEVKSLINYEYE
ncbi:MAG: adenine phosphoribosyltransferase [Candidatus Magasanikbacteria bacterium CG10_big_fil_rev_8_21_14_0_10_36_32]|uniref:Adenine phosphoribosyltransferase n=1 Tax=Candidatus Magasanikbacteria bacterium CG10_big_fil_rev_8_21_14_0_10_36_32 TaxID=1974646 RepID=A0A2M6W5L5_9BACT|nr:MAG: adenine phosphoribosyltransferase [Candidatus Magasanikbacteria bacterium CG10_big_fil_rev_8_21_14_0_10_36_32]